MAVEFGQNASRGDPVCSSSGSWTRTTSCSTFARVTRSPTSLTKLPARAESVSQPRIRRLISTRRSPPTGIVKVRAPAPSVTCRKRNSRGWRFGAASPSTRTGSVPSLRTTSP